MKVIRTGVSLLTIFMAIGLSSCHFGDTVEEMINKDKDVARDITFKFDAVKPGGSGTRVTLVDDELLGVTARWEETDEIALFDFGNVFVIDPETNLASPNAISLAYDTDADNHDMNDNGLDDIDDATFSGEAKSKMGNGVWNKQKFALFYPYAKVQNLSCAATDVTLDFTGQNGGLGNLAKKYLYAWGIAIGECNDGIVTMTDAMKSHTTNNPGPDDPICNEEWHNHAMFAGEHILLDNKMAIMRMSFINGGKTLAEHLAEPDKNLEISYIEIENLDATQPDFTRVVLSLSNGSIVPATGATNKLQIGDEINPAVIASIEQDHGTPGQIGGQDHVSWGSSIYVAIPCPETVEGDWFRPIITIHTKVKGSSQEGPSYFAMLGAHNIKEGDYYMTSAITASPSSDDLQVQETIFLYYHSAYVWDTDIY